MPRNPSIGETSVRVLLIKTSSLGDIVHTFPALTDASNAIPGIQFDWVVEEAFADIAAMHPAVRNVLPCAIRRWRKAPFVTWRNREWHDFKKRLKAEKYDLVIDAQGLIKSALITRHAQGEKVGLDKHSAREPLSARVLQRPIAVAKGQHAIVRLRELFAKALGYEVLATEIDSGLPSAARKDTSEKKSIIFFHGTTWATKHWPTEYWHALAKLSSAAGCRVVVPWSNDEEKERAHAIVQGVENAELLPKMTLAELLSYMLSLDGFVAVDTGLAHLSAAANLPGVVLYGPTNPGLTGVLSANSQNLSATFSCAPCMQEKCTYQGKEGAGIFPPCFSALPPDAVWRAVFAAIQ